VTRWRLLGAHHVACPVPWEWCQCAGLWAVEPADDLDDWYALFYDPDYDADPDARESSYADGWGRVYTRGAP
jgi:hypothetical protein